MADDTAWTDAGWQARLVMKRLEKKRVEFAESERQREAAERSRGRPLDGPWTQRKPKIMRRKL